MRELDLELTRREVEYLRVVKELSSNNKEIVHIYEIASRLNVKKSTVVETLQKLKTKGLIEYIPKRGVKLSDKGHAIIRKIERNHRILEYFFVQYLNIPLDRACKEASKIDIYISDDVINRICKLLGHPSRCPHGHPIPVNPQCCLEQKSN